MRKTTQLEPELREYPRVQLDVWCDKCGGPVDTENRNDLEIWLNQDACCAFYRFRDYCTPCLLPIWDAINDLIDSDPEAERDDTESNDQD